MKIRHFTSPLYAPSIEHSGFIELEGHHFITAISDPKSDEYHTTLNQYGHKNFRALKRSYKQFRFVWFTEEETYNSSDDYGNALPFFEFDSQDIDVIPWSKQRRMYGSNRAKQKQVVMMDEAAIDKGDNPYKWWVSRKRVSIECGTLHFQ